MQALQLLAWKHAPELREVPEPEPGPGEVVIRIAGAGACHSDLHLMHDFDAGVVPWNPPFTLGHENSGWIDALGPGVSGFEVGEAVLVHGPWGCGHCARCRLGMENYCDRQAEVATNGGGLGLDGGMAPKMLIPAARHLVKLGDLDPVEATPLTDAGLTPYHAVKRSLPLLGPGSTAVVIGAGGLGSFGIQLLEVLTPARIVAVDTRASALALAEDAGATATVTASDDVDAMTAAVTDALDGHPADVVLDFVGVDSTLALGARIVRQLGHLTIVGIGGGMLPVGFFSLAYEVSVATTYWGSVTELMEVVDLARAGKIRSHVARYPLSGALDAYAALHRGELDARAVIIPDES